MGKRSRLKQEMGFSFWNIESLMHKCCSLSWTKDSTTPRYVDSLLPAVIYNVEGSGPRRGEERRGENVCGKQHLSFAPLFSKYCSYILTNRRILHTPLYGILYFLRGLFSGNMRHRSNMLPMSSTFDTSQSARGWLNAEAP